ncbi:MAG: carbohydrate kinase family protein [Candidatus Promineifilaceae bacterium]|jgi:sugar/nucleoside kinase (ribokinase family)
MTEVLVSGLINIETTLKVDAFPLTYEPVRYPFFGINSSVSGVGYNIAKALTLLGDDVLFLSLIGEDLAGDQVRKSLTADRIDDTMILSVMPNTAQSVIIYNNDGKRQIHTDLKDIQDRAYPAEKFDEALAQCSLAVLCNINYNRHLLERAKRAGVLLATDVHTISASDDTYNSDFMAAADILFLSDEALPCSPEEFARRLQDRYGTAVIVIGLGAAGALLAVKDDNFMARIPAVQTRPIVNTIGAGDALFSSFLHIFSENRNPYEAVQKAVVFASYKIGEAGAAKGFLSAPELDLLVTSIKENGG